MKESLIFIPDISGFTKFVQETEAQHSEHVISEILQLLIDSNSIGLELIEIEGDALFFYKEELNYTADEILNQALKMFTNFYSHLELLRVNRICPCAACAKAPELKLKIVVHCGEVQKIKIGNTQKPFGQAVIEAHRLLKNSVQSDSYLLISDGINKGINIADIEYYKSFKFSKGEDQYDGKTIEYYYSQVREEDLNIEPVRALHKVEMTNEPDFRLEVTVNRSADEMYEIVSNYVYRPQWVKGVDKFVFNENEVTRNGTEHLCVIGGKNLHFRAITKDAPEGALVYGEATESIPIADSVYQFFSFLPLVDDSCKIIVENYFEANSFVKRLIIKYVLVPRIKKNINTSLKLLVNIQRS